MPFQSRFPLDGNRRKAAFPMVSMWSGSFTEAREGCCAKAYGLMTRGCFPVDAAAILVAFERVFANRHHVVGRVAVCHSVGDDGDASECGIAAHFPRGIAWGENAVEQVAVFKIIVCGLCACAS